MATPFPMRFEVTHRFRPFDLIAPEFQQLHREDVRLPADQPTTVRTGEQIVAPFGAVVLDVADCAPDGVITAGLIAEDGDGLLARYDAAEGQVRLEVTIAGETTRVACAPVSLRAPFQFAATLTGTKLTALADTGDGWLPLVTEGERLLALVDPRRPDVLARYAHGYGGRGAVLASVRAGYFGQVGMRDPHLVQYADGRPYLRDGKFLFTFGCAGMGFSQEAHWAVWEFDPARPERMCQVAKVFFAHEDGLVIGDNAGQIVYDNDTARFVIVVCGGDLPTPGVYVRYAETTEDVLSGVHVLPDTKLDAPMSLSAWEPAIAKIDGRWHVAYADVVALEPELRFHPVLVASADGGDCARLTLRAADKSVSRTEGCVLQRYDGEWYLLCTDDADKLYRVYDLDLNQVGIVDAPYLEGGPHPQVFPLPGGAEWQLVTFANVQYAEDVLGYGTEGEVVVMKSRMNSHGKETD